MNYFLSLVILISSAFLHIEGREFRSPLWSESFEQLLMQKAGEKVLDLSKFPSMQYPNTNFTEIPSLFPEGKVLVFGYGSLMNPESAGRSVNAEALASMRPVVALGVKRIFNYKASKTAHWGLNQHELEKAMLNLIPKTTFKTMTNGVVLEVDAKDFENLVKRETGYDLMPVLVADWNKLTAEDPEVAIRIAYTFIASDELRGGVDYTQTRYYPVRGYLQASRIGALVYGQDFLDFWNSTTYLANGTTLVNEWDEEHFEKLLCTKEP